MDYVTVREVRSGSGQVWKRLRAGEEFVVTRNGKPFALLLPTKPSEVDAAVRAYRVARFGMVLDRIHAHAKAHGLDRMTDEEIEAEIAAVRRERAAGARRMSGADDKSRH